MAYHIQGGLETIGCYQSKTSLMAQTTYAGYHHNKINLQKWLSLEYKNNEMIPFDIVFKLPFSKIACFAQFKSVKLNLTS